MIMNTELTAIMGSIKLIFHFITLILRAVLREVFVQKCQPHL